MYYDPDGIPVAERHEYARSGMTPWSADLREGMKNASFANARTEGGHGNGVLTAIEDFIKQSPLALRVFSLPTNYGLGIIYEEASRAGEFIGNELAPPRRIDLFLETIELQRINENLRVRRYWKDEA